MCIGDEYNAFHRSFSLSCIAVCIESQKNRFSFSVSFSLSIFHALTFSRYLTLSHEVHDGLSLSLSRFLSLVGNETRDHTYVYVYKICGILTSSIEREYLDKHGHRRADDIRDSWTFRWKFIWSSFDVSLFIYFCIFLFFWFLFVLYNQKVEGFREWETGCVVFCVPYCTGALVVYSDNH